MSLIDGGHSHETTPLAGPRASSAERTELHSPGRAQLQSLFRRADTHLVPETCLSPLVTSTFVQGSRLRLLPSPCTRWVVPCSRNFLPYPKFVLVSWLLSNILVSPSFFKLMKGARDGARDIGSAAGKLADRHEEPGAAAQGPQSDIPGTFLALVAQSVIPVFLPGGSVEAIPSSNQARSLCIDRCPFT
jgi:hypothetical protein